MRNLIYILMAVLLCNCSKDTKYSEIDWLDWSRPLTEKEAIKLVKKHTREELQIESIKLIPFNNEGDFYARNTIDPASGGYVMWRIPENATLSYTTRLEVSVDEKTIKVTVGKNK